MMQAEAISRLVVPPSVLTGTSPLDHALALVRAGFQCIYLHSPVAPVPGGGCTCKNKKECRSVGKHPVAKAWQKNVMVTESQVRDEFSNFQNWIPNLGMPLGPQPGAENNYLIAIDIDDEARFAELIAEYGPLPLETASTRSGRGRHLLFWLPSDTPLDRLHPKNITGLGKSNQKNGDVPGVDVKVERGQIAIPPSLHHSGARYAWERVGTIQTLPAAWTIAILDPPQIPQWAAKYTPQTMHDSAHASKRMRAWLTAAVTGEATILARTSEGGRNTALYKSLCNLLRKAKGTNLPTSWGYVVDEISRAARASGLGEQEIRSTVASAEKRVEEEGGVLYPREVSFSAKQADPDRSTRHEPDGLPTLKITTALADVTDTTVAALAAGDKQIYQRDAMLVQVVQPSEYDAEGPKIVAMAPATLLERLTRVAKYLKSTKDSWVPSIPSKELAQAVFHRKQWDGIRTLIGILEAPSLRPDGSIVETPGYDESTKFIYAPSCAFLPVPEKPTQEDAIRALEELREVFVDFPFAAWKHARPGQDNPGREVPIAAILTLLARPAIRGACPGFLFDAPTPGTGKSLCGDAVCTIATGRPSPRGTYPSDEVEQEKILGACALRGRLVVGFDNVGRPFGGDPIDKYLTAIDTVDVRVLGRTDMPTMRWRGVMIASGNNFDIIGDTFRRVLKCRIEAREENPENRTGFKHDPLLTWILSERPRLLRAALTMLRAYIVAGRPAMMNKPMGSFEPWSYLIVQTILYAGGQNVLNATPEGDSKRGVFSSLLVGWIRLQNIPLVDASNGKSYLRGRTSREALEFLYPSSGITSPPQGFDDLKEAMEILTSSSSGRPPHPRKLADQLRRIKDRPFGQMRLLGKEDRDGIMQWEVTNLEGGWLQAAPKAQTEPQTPVVAPTY